MDRPLAVLLALIVVVGVGGPLATTWWWALHGMSQNIGTAWTVTWMVIDTPLIGLYLYLTD